MNYKIFSYTNFAYVDMATLWASQMERLELNYSIFCTDQESYDFLSKKNIDCALSTHPLPSQRFHKEGSLQSDGFVALGLIRFQILADLLKVYENVIYSDLDAVWLKDPLPEVLDSSFDASFSISDAPYSFPTNIRHQWGVTACTGWMHFNNSCHNFISDFVKEYYNVRTRPDERNDQAKFNCFLHSINKKINKNIDNHSFTLDLPEYNLKTLGLSTSLIQRPGKYHTISPTAKVIHPILTWEGEVSNKIQVLRRILDKEGNIFDDVYRDGGWRGTPQFPSSGPGSHDPALITPYIEALKRFIKSNNIKTITDLGCGDFNVGNHFLDDCERYIACDISPTILSLNAKKFKSNNLEFKKLDLSKEELPPADLGCVRQVLQHLSNSSILSFIDTVHRTTPFKFLLVTEHVPRDKFIPNLDQLTGGEIRLKKENGVSGVVLHEKPFNLLHKNFSILCSISNPSIRVDGVEGELRSTLYSL